jgi:hypothetical protein
MWCAFSHFAHEEARVRGFTTTLLAMTALAGTAAGSYAQTTHPPPELGVGVTWLVPRPGGDYVTDQMTEPNAVVRFTMPFASSFAIEGLVSIGQQDDDPRQRTEGLYVVQIKQRLPGFEQRPLHIFITYGVVGYYAHVVQREVEYGNGQRVRGFSYSEIEEPLATQFGVGIQRRLTPRLAIRGDAQLLTLLTLPLGYSFSTGVSVALGHYSTN